MNVLQQIKMNLQCGIIILLSGIVFNSILFGVCWRAVPANQAMYALRSTGAKVDSVTGKLIVPDELLPRDQLNFVYKFGWCRSDVLSSQFLRKSVNLTLPSKQDQQATYIYLLESMHTIRFAFQCVVMKAYVNRKYLFYKSRLPLYYCQGTVYILLLRTVNRFAIHEFYLYNKLAMPVNFAFEFYQAPPL